ncbi:alpha-L-fucosidase, partial [Elizabethkingia anophelis]|uniref:alpha-L-fucosidase n=1 Tax=Elizabethkingia anophelis TaxID=1117645 RepID=UPI0038928B95
MNKLILSLWLLISFCIGTVVSAQGWAGKKERPKEKITLKYGPVTPPHRTDEAMQKFRQYGIGQFIHWGIYAIPGGEWDGVKANTATEWIRAWGG